MKGKWLGLINAPGLVHSTWIMVLFVLAILPSHPGFAQSPNRSNYGTLTGSYWNAQGTVALDYFHCWRPGKAGKFEWGIGGRVTSIFGKEQYFSSAPPSLASDAHKTDSLFLLSSQLNAINLALSFRYRLSPRFALGFNIDFLGVTLGVKRNATYINGAQVQSTFVQPTLYNILLVGTNDRGTLNSQFLLRYTINEDLWINVGLQHLFTEYTAETDIQQNPQPNARFRDISNLVSLGLTVRLNQKNSDSSGNP